MLLTGNNNRGLRIITAIFERKKNLCLCWLGKEKMYKIGQKNIYTEYLRVAWTFFLFKVSAHPTLEHYI